MIKKISFLLLASLIFMACKKEKGQIQTIDPVEEVIEPITDFKNENGYQIGNIAADFSLLGTDGKMHSLEQYKNAKGAIVIFTCNHCPYSKAYEDRIVALDNKYNSLGFPVIAINPNDPAVQPEDSMEEMIIRAKEKNFPFPYLIDEGQKVYPKYGATKTPHVFVLKNEDKGFTVQYIGAIDDNYEDTNNVTQKYVEQAVDALLNNKPVETKKTVAIGCSIKTKK